MALTPDQLRRFQDLLQLELRKVVEGIRAMTLEAHTSPREASGDLSAYSIHMADLASDTYERERSIGLIAQEQKRLEQINNALKRIEDETYGYCKSCGTEISGTRLNAVPDALMCIACQRAQEEQGER